MVVRFPTSFGVGRNGRWPSRGSQSHRELQSYNHFLAVLPSERAQKGSTQAFLYSIACFFFSFYKFSSHVISSLSPPSMYTSTVQPGASGPLLPMQRSHPIIAHKHRTLLSTTAYFLYLHPPHPLIFLSVFIYSASYFSPDSLTVLQWNVGDLRAGSTKLLRFILLHPVDLICNQESNSKSSSTFQITGFSVLQFDRTHSRPGILSPHNPNASLGVIIFIWQSVSFSEFAISFSLYLTFFLTM